MNSKLFLFPILVLLFNNNIQAQKSVSTDLKTGLKNELSVDFFNLMFNKYNLSYNRLYNESASYGMSMSYSPKIVTVFDDFNYKEKFTLSINHKFYFSNKKNQGFYFEGYLQYRYGEILNPYITNNLQNEPERKNFGSLDVGINFGYKYVNKQNFFFDVKAGFAKRLTDFQPSIKNYYTNPYRLNFSFGIGKRF